MRKLRTRGLIPLLVIAAIAAATHLFPQATQQVIDTAGVITHTDNFPDSEYWQLVEGIVYDGDTLRVKRCEEQCEELKIRLCGKDAPEKDQALGIEARDHLQSLIDQGDGTVIVLPVEQDRDDRTVAELFVPVVGREEEIHLNSQMTYDGYAYHYEQYSDSCPNQSAIALGEERARAERAGVWMDLNAVKPWDYRQQSKTH